MLIITGLIEVVHVGLLETAHIEPKNMVGLDTPENVIYEVLRQRNARLNPAFSASLIV